jgi:hypothetical protein
VTVYSHANQKPENSRRRLAGLLLPFYIRFLSAAQCESVQSQGGTDVGEHRFDRAHPATVEEPVARRVQIGFSYSLVYVSKKDNWASIQ